MPKGPFDDELTPEEEALLQNDTTVPPAEEEGEGSVEEAIAAAEAGNGTAPESDGKSATDAPADGKTATSAEAGAEQKPDPEPTEEQELAAFLDKHKDKSPEELARLALQQSRRANRAEATNRQVRDQVSQLAERARAAAARRDEVKTSAPERIAQFKARLAEDPDAAVEELFSSLVNREVSEADAAAQQARFDEAIVYADQHIPNFSQQWPGMKGLANEIGFTDEELDRTDDARSLIVLSLANHTARLMKAGIMDRFGNIVNLPQTAPTEEAKDPRLTAPEPQRPLGGGARSARANADVSTQLAEILAMSPTEFDKFDRENPGVIENLMRQAA